MAIEFPNIDPVALSLGPLDVRWYALAYLGGILIGWWYALRLAGRFEMGKSAVTRQQIDDFIPWAIIGVIVGGRVGYGLFYQFDYFVSNPLHILMIWNGGMAFHGGALGVIAAMVLFCLHHKIPLLRFTDIVACVVPIGLFFGRIANFVNGELYGRVTDVSWAVVFPGGGDVPRHPSQLYEAGLEGLLLGLVLAVLACFKSVWQRPGLLSAVFLLGYGLSRFVVEFFRAPDAHIGLIGNALSMGQILTLPMVLGSLVLMAIVFRAK